MNNVLRVTKQTFTMTVAVATILWSIGISAFVAPLVAQGAVTPLADVPDGSLIKGTDISSVYYYDGAERFVFPNEKTYKTWYPNFEDVTIHTISMADLGTLSLGANVVYRPGSRLVKIDTMPNVYAVGPNGGLYWIPDEATARRLYGANWASRVDDVPDAFFTNYLADPDMDLSVDSLHPDGSVVSHGGSNYLVTDGMLHMLSEDVFASDMYRDEFVSALSDDDFAAHTVGDAEVAGAHSSPAQAGRVVTPPPGGGTTTPPPVVAGTVSVMLDSTNPSTGTLLADSSAAADGASMLAPMMALKFTAGGTEAKIKTLKFNRIGIASDSDVDSLYLYDGWNRLADHTSFNKKVVTFSNSAGLFTVPANSSKVVMVRMDLANSVDASKSIGFELSAATSVELVGEGGSVSGSFPVSGALMTTTQVADLGTIQYSNVSTYPATIDPGVTNRELWRFSLTAGSQDVQLEYLRLTNVGTIDPSHLQNLRLEVLGTQVGATIPVVSADKYATFDLSATPYKLASGQTRVFTLRGDVAGGAGRTFKFTVQRGADVRAKDLEYGAHIELRASAGTDFSLIEPTTGTGTTVNSGTLTIGLASDTPNDTVSDGATNVTLGKFTFKAVGESVKISNLTAACSSSDTDVDLINLKVLLDGSQIGSTDATMNCNAWGTTQSFTFGNTFVAKEGVEHIVSLVADTTDADSTNNDTIQVRFDAGSSNAQRQVTLGSFNTTAQSGKSLTIKSGALATSKNQAFGDKSSTNPTGVVNGTNVKIASFVITGGGGEDADVTQIQLQDDSAVTQMGDNFQNLKLMHGDTQIGVTFGTLNSGGTVTQYAFSPSPAIRIGKNEPYVVDVYADVKSSAVDDATQLVPVVELYSVTASGIDTGSDASDNTVRLLQEGYLAANGTFRAVVDSDTPIATQLVMGATSQDVAKFKLSANAAETVNVKTFVATFAMSSLSTSTVKNIKLIDAAGNQVGQTLSSLAFSDSAGSTTVFAKFDNLTLPVTQNGSVVLTVRADMTSFLDSGIATTGKTFLVSLESVDYDLDTAGNQTSVTAIGAQSGTTLTADFLIYAASGTTDVDQDGSLMTLYRTKLGAAYASDSPSGASTGGTAQTVAKVVLSNTANVGSYDATVNLFNITLNNTGISQAQATNRALTVYKDNTGTTALGTTNWLHTTASVSFGNPAASQFEYNGGTFTDVNISAGASKTFIFTLDTSDAGTNDRLAVSVAAGQITWSDGSSTSLTSVNDLPLLAKTLTY